jgi:hypothetical protein
MPQIGMSQVAPQQGGGQMGSGPGMGGPGGSPIAEIMKRILMQKMMASRSPQGSRPMGGGR